MPQLGIHLLTGMVNIWPREILSKFLKRGLIIGSIIPDLDFLPLILTYKIDRALAISFHRSFSHSVFVALFILFSGIIFKSKKPKLYYFLIACGIGMFLHIFLDLFMWFASVKIFWPFGKEYSIWGNIIIPDSYWNLMSSLECLSYGIFICVFHKVYRIAYSFAFKIILFLLFTLTLVIGPIGFHLSRIEFEPFSYSIAIIFGFIPSIFLIRKYWGCIV